VELAEEPGVGDGWAGACSVRRVRGRCGTDQPLARLLVPVRKQVQLLGEWRQVSMGQAFDAYNEAFGVQQITIGLRLGR
jgi:hypothetical protein